MRRIMPFLLAALVAVALSSCASTDAKLLIAPEKGLETTTTETSAIGARSQDGLQMVAGSDFFDGKNVNFVVSLASVGGGTFTFRETDLALYGGNSDKNKWTLIERWNSQDFLSRAADESGAAVMAAGVIGTLFILDAIFNPNDTDISIGYDFGYPIGLSRSVYFHGSGPVGAAITALGAIETTIALSQLADLYQAEIDSTVLRNAVIAPDTPAAGNVYFRDIPKYPDYKLVYDNGNQDMEFTFMRSDRAELIDPWADRSSLLVAFNYSYNFGSKRNCVSISALAPKYLGGFAGLSFSSDDSFGGRLGLNWKLMPYIWLQGGVELYGGKDSSGSVGVLALAGMEVCVRHLSIYGGAAYDVRQRRFSAEIGGGLAF